MSDARDGPDLAQVFPHIPQLSAEEPASFDITPLSGFTNHNLRLQRPGEDWVLRVPRAQTAGPIDRSAEQHNQALAHSLGIAPLPAWQNTAGLSLTPTLVTSRPPSASDFRDTSQLDRLLEPLRRLHRSGLVFCGGLDLRATLEQHLALVDAALRPRFANRMRQAMRVLALLDGVLPPPVPCHRDPVLGNLLIDDDSVWLIDWEYSAMASPYWDLAVLCNEADLDLDESRRLLQVYAADETPLQESVLFDYRGLLGLLNDLWMAAFVDDPKAT